MLPSGWLGMPTQSFSSDAWTARKVETDLSVLRW